MTRAKFLPLRDESDRSSCRLLTVFVGLLWAATVSPAADPAAEPGPPADPLKDHAREVVFGAQRNRPKLGVPVEPPPEDGPRIVEGTGRPAVTDPDERSRVAGRTDRRALPGRDDQTGTVRSDGADQPGSDRRALPGREDRTGEDRDEGA